MIQRRRPDTIYFAVVGIGLIFRAFALLQSALGFNPQNGLRGFSMNTAPAKFAGILLFMALPLGRAQEETAATQKALDHSIALYSQKIYQGNTKTDLEISEVVGKLRALKSELKTLQEENNATDRRMESLQNEREAKMSEWKLQQEAFEAEDAELDKEYARHEEEFKTNEQRRRKFYDDEAAAMKLFNDEVDRLNDWLDANNKKDAELAERVEAFRNEAKVALEKFEERTLKLKEEAQEQTERHQDISRRGGELQKQLELLGGAKVKEVLAAKVLKSTPMEEAEAARRANEAAARAKTIEDTRRLSEGPYINGGREKVAPTDIPDPKSAPVDGPIAFSPPASAMNSRLSELTAQAAAAKAEIFEISRHPERFADKSAQATALTVALQKVQEVNTKRLEAMAELHKFLEANTPAKEPKRR